MKIGFTGTQRGTTPEQFKALCQLIRDTQVTEWHHGCCVGADNESVEAVTAWAKTARVVAHPPEKKAKLSELSLMFSHVRRKPRSYLERNRDIVNECELLIACPKEDEEERRSGTWATIRYARKKDVRIVIVWPDGTLSAEGGGRLI